MWLSSSYLFTKGLHRLLPLLALLSILSCLLVSLVNKVGISFAFAALDIKSILFICQFSLSMFIAFTFTQNMKRSLLWWPDDSWPLSLFVFITFTFTNIVVAPVRQNTRSNKYTQNMKRSLLWWPDDSWQVSLSSPWPPYPQTTSQLWRQGNFFDLVILKWCCSLYNRLKQLLRNC